MSGHIGGFRVGDRVRIVLNEGEGETGEVYDLDTEHGWRVWVRVPAEGGTPRGLSKDPDDLEHIAPDDTTLGDDIRALATRDGTFWVLLTAQGRDAFAAQADALTAALREAREALAQVDPVTVSMNTALTVRAERAEAENVDLRVENAHLAAQVEAVRELGPHRIVSTPEGTTEYVRRADLRAALATGSTP